MKKRLPPHLKKCKRKETVTLTIGPFDNRAVFNVYDPGQGK